MRYIGERLVLALLGLTLMLAMTAVAQAQGSGILEGTVVNGTAEGAEIGAGIPVTLYLLQGNTTVDALETTTDAEGRFRFEGLDTDADLEYWPEVVYAQVPYGSAEPYQFDGDQPTLSATLTVYETTEDDSTVSLDSVHLIAESFGEVLRISEIHLFGNSGDQTYIGRARDTDRLTTVSIPLPENAVGLALEQDTSGERYLEVEGGLLDTEPVPPGSEASLTFLSYHLVVDGDLVPLERRFAYPVSMLTVLVAQPGLTFRSDQLQARGPELFQGRQYDFFVTQDLQPDTPLVMELVPVADMTAAQGAEGAPMTSEASATSTATRGNQGMLRWLGFSLAGMAVVSAVVYSLASMRSIPAPSSSPDLMADPKARSLLAQLAELEEASEAGDIDGATYDRHRAEIYDSLKSLRV